MENDRKPGGLRIIKTSSSREAENVIRIGDDALRETAAAARRLNHNQNALRGSSWQSYIARTRTLRQEPTQPTPIAYGAEIRARREKK